MTESELVEYVRQAILAGLLVPRRWSWLGLLWAR